MRIRGAVVVFLSACSVFAAGCRACTDESYTPRDGDAWSLAGAVMAPEIDGMMFIDVTTTVARLPSGEWKWRSVGKSETRREGVERIDETRSWRPNGIGALDSGPGDWANLLVPMGTLCGGDVLSTSEWPRVVVVGFERVKTFSGGVSDCLRLEYELPHGEKFVEWHAPRLGVVRWEERIKGFLVDALAAYGGEAPSRRRILEFFDWPEVIRQDELARAPAESKR